MSEVVGSLVVGEDVGGGGIEKRRCFNEGDVRRGKVVGEEFDDLGLNVGCCSCGAWLSVLCLTCVVCKGMYDYFV